MVLMPLPPILFPRKYTSLCLNLHFSRCSFRSLKPRAAVYGNRVATISCVYTFSHVIGRHSVHTGRPFGTSERTFWLQHGPVKLRNSGSSRGDTLLSHHIPIICKMNFRKPLAVLLLLLVCTGRTNAFWSWTFKDWYRKITSN